MARSTHRWRSAGFLVLLGVVLLLFTTDTVDSVDVWTWLPGLFVLFGAWSLVASRGRNLTGPLLVIVVAGAFLLQNLDYIPPDTVTTWWPLVFVLLGLLLLLNRGRRRSRRTVSENGDVTTVAVFSGGTRRVGTDAFRGGDVVAIFGEPTIDLRDATLEEAPAVVEIVAVFGGVELSVPENWTVAIETVSILGSVDDNRRAPGTDSDPDLVLTGVSVFGSVELTD